MESVTRTSTAGADERPLDVETVVATHGDFLWRSLQRFGVRAPDLADVMQEVLIVIHRKLADYDRARPIEPWLFALCAKTSSTYRKRAFRRIEIATDPIAVAFDAGASAASASPDAALERAEARAELEAVLDLLAPEQRALLVMFELEEMSCDEIAKTIGIAKGTVFSRLHSARKEFARVLARHEKLGGRSR